MSHADASAPTDGSGAPRCGAPAVAQGHAPFHARQAGGAPNGAAPARSTSDSWSAVRSSVRSKLCERRSTAVNRGHSETAEIAACGQQRSPAVTPGYPWGVNYGSEGWGFDSLQRAEPEPKALVTGPTRGRGPLVPPQRGTFQMPSDHNICPTEIWLSALRAAGRSPNTIGSYAAAVDKLRQWRQTAPESGLETLTRLEAMALVKHLQEHFTPGGVAVRSCSSCRLVVDARRGDGRVERLRPHEDLRARGRAAHRRRRRDRGDARPRQGQPARPRHHHPAGGDRSQATGDLQRGDARRGHLLGSADDQGRVARRETSTAWAPLSSIRTSEG